MNKIDRYIIREIIPPTLLSLSLYIFLLLMNVLFDVAREAVQNNLGLGIVLKLLFYQLPQLLVVSLPMSILLGCMIGVGRLSADSELVALQSAGVPFRRLVRPVLLLGVIGSLVCFYFVALVAPEGAYLHHLIKREVYLSRYVNLDRIVPRVFHDQIPGVLLYYGSRNEETGGFERVFLYEREPSGDVERVTVARRGELSFDADGGSMQLYLEDGTTHARQVDAEPLEGYSVTSFQTFHQSKEAPAFIQAFSRDLRRNHREMSLGELAHEVSRARAEPNKKVRRLRLGLASTNWHERFALPAAALIFALLGLPLGVVNRRGGKASGFAMSLAVVLVYWVGYSVLRDLSETGKMPALVALWLPNTFFAGLALVLIARRGGRDVASTLGRSLGRLGALLRRRRRTRPTRPAKGPDETLPALSGAEFPQLLDRYVVRSFFQVFAFVMLSIYIVYLLVEFRSLAQDMVDNNIPLSTVLQYLFFLVPRMTANLLPVACLVATLVGVGLMARSHEVTAVKAAGVSLHRLLLPLLLVTSGFCLLGFYLQDEVLPTTNRAAEELRDSISGRTPRSRNPRHRWIMGQDSRLYHYENADRERRRFQGLSVFQLDPSTFELRSRTFSSQAQHQGGAWLFRDGWRRSFDNGASDLEIYQRQRIELPVTPAFFQSEDTVLFWGIQRQPDEMSYADQRNYIRELTRRGYDTTALKVALARKFSFPVIPVFMVLLGFPFSFRVGNHGSLFGVGIAIGLTVVYWAALAVFSALGTAEILSPLLAAWTPNVLFGGLGLYMSLHLRT